MKRIEISNRNVKENFLISEIMLGVADAVEAHIHIEMLRQ